VSIEDNELAQERSQLSALNLCRSLGHSHVFNVHINALRVHLTVSIPMCIKIRYKDYISQTHPIYFSC